MDDDYAADAVRSPCETPVLLARWTHALQDAQRLRLGDARPDGFASLQWRRAASSERWLRLRILHDDDANANALAVEFLLLTQQLMAADPTECEQQVLSWLNDPASLKAMAVRLRRCCMGGCRLPGADVDPIPLSPVVPCVRHSLTWRRPDGAQEKNAIVAAKTKQPPLPHAWTLGVVLDFEDGYDEEFLTLLARVCGDPLGKDNGLSDAFKATYRQLSQHYLSPGISTVRLHIRLSARTPSAESLQQLSTSVCNWQLSKRQSFSLNGLDVAVASLNEFLAAAPMLPFHKLLVCASSSMASRMDPLATTTKPLDDTTLRLLLTKSQHFLLELEVCNLRLRNFDCIVQPYASGTCLLQTLRLREFATDVVTDGGIFAALGDPYHPIAQTLEELEIDQALHSAGGLSLWLEREAGAMLLKNDRLVACLIRQACSIYPSTTHKGFRQTHGRAIRVPVPIACQRAFLTAKPIKLPHDVTERILEFAERSAVRDAQMHYRFILPDQLHTFTRDLDAWKTHRVAPYECLPYGSYYH